MEQIDGDGGTGGFDDGLSDTAVVGCGGRGDGAAGTRLGQGR